MLNLILSYFLKYYQSKEVKKGVENHFEPFLPTTSELEEMDRDSFEGWVLAARQQIPKRAEKRDPLLFLKKRICEILSDKGLSEAQKERRVLNEIERYDRVKSSICQPL